MRKKHIYIMPHGTFLEFMLPDGRYMYYEFEPNHKLKEKITWYI